MDSDDDDNATSVDDHILSKWRKTHHGAPDVTAQLRTDPVVPIGCAYTSYSKKGASK